MTKLSLLFCALLGSCGGYQPPAQSRNSRDVSLVVKEHLRAVEAGDWDQANALLSERYSMKMKGMPFFISIGKSKALDVHRARKQAFPDFKFNETLEPAGPNGVRVVVRWSGTHTGFLDYPVGNLPKTPATHKAVALPEEYFTYYVEDDHIVYTYGEIPEGHGPPALKQQLGLK